MIGIVRGVITVALLLLFTAMAVWAWSDRRKQLFESMARMALEEDPADAASSEAGRHE